MTTLQNVHSFGHQRSESELPQSSFSVKADLLLAIHNLNPKTLQTLKLTVRPQPALQNILEGLVSLFEENQSWQTIQKYMGQPKLFQDKLSTFVYCPETSKLDGRFQQCLNLIPQLKPNFTNLPDLNKLYESLRSITEMFSVYKQILAIESSIIQDASSSQHIRIVEDKFELSAEKKKGDYRSSFDAANQDFTQKKQIKNFRVEKTPEKAITNRSQQSSSRSKPFLERPPKLGYYDHSKNNKSLATPKTNIMDTPKPVYQKSENNLSPQPKAFTDDFQDEQQQIESQLSQKLFLFLQDQGQQQQPQINLTETSTKAQDQNLSQLSGETQKKRVKTQSPLADRLSFMKRVKPVDPIEKELRDQLKQNQKEILELQNHNRRLNWEIERESKKLSTREQKSYDEHEWFNDDTSILTQKAQQEKQKYLEEKRLNSFEKMMFWKKYKIISQMDVSEYLQNKDSLTKNNYPFLKGTPKQALRLRTEPSEQSSHSMVQKYQEQIISKLKESVEETSKQKDQLKKEHDLQIKTVNQFSKKTPFKWAIGDHVFKIYS